MSPPRSTEEIAGVLFEQDGDRLSIRTSLGLALRMAVVFYFVGGVFVAVVYAVALLLHPSGARTAAFVASLPVLLLIVANVVTGRRPLVLDRASKRLIRGKAERSLGRVVEIRPQGPDQGQGAFFLRAHCTDGSNGPLADHVAFPNVADVQRAADRINGFLGLLASEGVGLPS